MNITSSGNITAKEDSLMILFASLIACPTPKGLSCNKNLILAESEKVSSLYAFSIFPLFAMNLGNFVFSEK